LFAWEPKLNGFALFCSSAGFIIDGGDVVELKGPVDYANAGAALVD